MVAVNKARMWVVAEQLIGEADWSAKIGTLAGCVDPTPSRLREVLASDTRDVLVFAPDRVVAVQPKPARKLGLISGLRAAAGNPSGLGRVRSVARHDVVGFSVSSGVPGALDLASGLATAIVQVREGAAGGSIVFAVDTSIIALGAIEQNIAGWLRPRT